MDPRQGESFGASFDNRFSAIGLAKASTVGALNGMSGASMFKWAEVPNDIGNIVTAPGLMIRANGIALGQTAGRAAQNAAKDHSAKK